MRVSHRLTRSPACLVVEEHDMAMSLQKMLKAAGHDVPSTAPILEINPRHPLVMRLKDESDAQRLADGRTSCSARRCSARAGNSKTLALSYSA